MLIRSGLKWFRVLEEPSETRGMFHTMGRPQRGWPDKGMATIHELRLQPREATSPQPVSAEIIIFPGIRYEYWDAQASAKAGPKRPAKARRRARRVKRDYLEIPA